MGTLRKYALNRLGVAPRDRAKLNEILDRGIDVLLKAGTAGLVQKSGGETFITAPSATVEPRVRGFHKSFGTLLKMVGAGLHAYLPGPAGSGKSTAGEQVADKLGLEFYCQSVGQQTTQSHLLGYMDANGNYVTTTFRKAFEEGGVFLLDEVDAGNANVLTVLNSALANGLCSFPDGMVRMHANFRCIAAANTFGTGADRQYVGRNQLDAASIDRFAFLEWGYDEELELQIASNQEWTRFVQRVRRVVSDLKIRHVVSPRASINGSKLLAAGMDRASVEESTIWKGMDPATRAKVVAALR